MFINDYKPEESKSFDCIDGDHRVKIVKVENTTSKSGLRMIQLTLQVEGVPMPYIQFICEGYYFNSSMTRIFDAFKITRGNFQFGTWLNKIGYAHFEHKKETYTNNGVQHKTNRAKLIYFHNSVEVPQNVQALQQAVSGTVQSAESFPDDIPF